MGVEGGGLRPDAAGAPYVLTPVTVWAHLRPAARPRSYCPVCLERVTLRLGPRNRHHYGHRPESTCSAAGAEGALHLSAKLRLGEELARGLPLRLQHLCHRIPQERGTERCTPAPVEAWDGVWDEVRIEHTLPAVRADLLLLRRGKPVLALEVYASHAVDVAKARKYRGMELPWIEVSARHIAPEAGVPWTAADPLPVLAASHHAEWRCPRHQALHEAYLEHERNGTHRFAWRLAHLYRRDGGIAAASLRTEGVLLWMLERRENGHVVEAWIEREDRDQPLAPPLAVQGREGVKRRLHGQFLAWKRWTESDRGARVDSPMPWRHDEPEPKRERGVLYPERLRHNPQLGVFQGVPGIPAVAWPLPLHASAEPHPLFGNSPVGWSDRPVRDQIALTHSVVGPVWLTMRHHEWLETGRRRSRADLALFVHDGRRWTAGPTHSETLAVDGVSPWPELLPVISRRVHAEDGPGVMLAGRFAELVAETARERHPVELR